jgi:hypothetical protein
MWSPPLRLFLLFNHELTPTQRQAALEELGVGELTPLPPALQRLWRQIPAEVPELAAYLRPLREWLAAQARQGDFVLIQGDFGATCLMVQYAQEQGLIPVYATTRRVSRDEPQPDGSVRTTRCFEHRRFRKYGV